MKLGRIIKFGVALALGASIGLALGSPAYADHDDDDYYRSGSNTVRVDCNDGETINRAIRRANPAEKLTISVRGTCVENVVIDRDWVTLQPSKWSGGSIESDDESKVAIRITGHHVTVQDFDGDSISGGVSVLDGGSASILNNTITGAKLPNIPIGLIVSQGSFALIEGNVIKNNTFGVIISFTSHGRFGSNQIILNDDYGLGVGDNASAELSPGNTVANNGQAPVFNGDGLVMWRSGVVRFREGNALIDNAGFGIFCGGFGEIRGADAINSPLLTGNADGPANLTTCLSFQLL